MPIRFRLAVIVGVAASVIVATGATLDHLNDAFRQLHHSLWLVGPLVVVAAAVGAWILAGRVLQPVDKMRAEADAISDAGLDSRLAVPGTNDSLAALAVTLNRLLDRLQSSLSGQREFVSAASHELRTPLAALKAEIEMANHAGSLSPDDQQAVFDEVEYRVEQLIRLSESLLVLAQGDEGSMRFNLVLQPVEPLVRDSLAAYQAAAGCKEVMLALDTEPGVECEVDGVRFEQIVGNLLDNAIRYAPSGSVVEVSLHRCQDTAVLTVIDQGPGMPEEFLPVAFDRFSRGDPSRSLSGEGSSGSGLGLAIVRMLVERHGGTVSIDNLPSGGAQATVEIPSPTRPPVGSSANRINGVKSAYPVGHVDSMNLLQWL